jgi:predicted RNA-binding Zn-ribbon protein involved in translation (DUF1610 family)
MTWNQHQPCPACRSEIIYRTNDGWRNLSDYSLHTCPITPEANAMAKNTEKQGETKSAPKEIAKMATTACTSCGLAAVQPIVVKGKCANAIACAKRRRRTERLAKEQEEAEAGGGRRPPDNDAARA